MISITWIIIGILTMALISLPLVIEHIEKSYKTRKWIVKILGD